MTEQEKWIHDQKNWKMGLFYFNAADKRLFPPKYNRMGWTINFANPKSVLAGIVVTALIIVFTVALVVLIKPAP